LGERWGSEPERLKPAVPGHVPYRLRDGLRRVLRVERHEIRAAALRETVVREADDPRGVRGEGVREPREPFQVAEVSRGRRDQRLAQQVGAPVGRGRGSGRPASSWSAPTSPPARSAQDLALFPPGTDRQVVPRCGHFVPREQPGVVAGAILWLLARTA
jgi:pimeloyl-ACP methyl ester carboxylesterase